MNAAWRVAFIAGLVAVTTAACSQWPGASLTGPSATTTSGITTTSGTPPPPPPGSTTPSPTPSPGASVAYTQDIQPFLTSDCSMCHSQLRTYSGTMAVVQPGNQNSLLVVATRPGGLMYRYLTGNASSKSNLIYQWVVNNNAAQSR